MEEQKDAIESVTCDECAHRFYPRRMQFRKEGEVQITYFSCPECDHEYEVCRTNPELRKLRQKIENLKTCIARQGASGRPNKHKFQEYWDLCSEYKQKMDEFNGKEIAVVH